MLPGLWNFHHIYYSCPSALPYTWISTKVCEERGVQQRGCHPNQFSLLHTMGSYSGDSEYSLYGLPEWLLISMSCYFSLFSLGSQRTLHLFLRSIWARKDSLFFIEANILVLLTLHISAGIVSGLSGCLWAEIHLRNCTQPSTIVELPILGICKVSSAPLPVFLCSQRSF